MKTKYIFKSVLFCVSFTALFVVFSFAKGFIPESFERIAHGIIGSIAALVITVLFLKADKKRFSDIGLVWENGTFPRLLAGIVIGIVIMGTMATSVMYFTGASIEVNDKSTISDYILATLPLLPLAYMEELGFRAYPLEILKNKVGIRPSIIITSLLFALYHIVNGWSVATSFMGPAIWGLVFGIAAIFSKGIAMPTGIHYAANLTSSAFGAEGNTVSLWNVTRASTPVEEAQGINWSITLPVVALLVFGIVCIEIYMRRIRYSGRSTLA